MDDSRRRRGRELDSPWTIRGDDAAASWIFRGDKSREASRGGSVGPRSRARRRDLSRLRAGQDAQYIDNAVDRYRDCRYVLAVDEGALRGYVSEKLVSAYLAGAVPPPGGTKLRGAFESAERPVDLQGLRLGSGRPQPSRSTGPSGLGDRSPSSAAIASRPGSSTAPRTSRRRCSGRRTRRRKSPRSARRRRGSPRCATRRR